MNINKLRLRNFRGFPNATLNLKPLTVLLGPNSSGKSSFCHPLAALSHCQKQYSGRRDASLSPRTAREAEEWPIDLGGWSDLVTSGSTGRVYIDFLTSEGWVEFGFGEDATFPNNLLLSYLASPQNLDVTSATTGDATTKGFNSATEIAKTKIPSGTSRSHIGSDMSELPEQSNTRLTLEKNKIGSWTHDGMDAVVGLDGLLPLALQHATGTEFKLNLKSFKEVRSLLETLVYLRANRKRPSRGYQHFLGERRAVGYAGERTASVLFNSGSQQAEYLLPPIRPSGNSEKMKVQWVQEETSLNRAVAFWLKHLGLANLVETKESIRYGPELLDVRVAVQPEGLTRDLTEVGFGVSQAIPVVVAALLQPLESLFIVDLPEAHLHPRPQSELADLFCAMAMSGRYSLVETHSEMFFHRLRLRAAMEPDLMDRIAVYFVDVPNPDGTCSHPRYVGLRPGEDVEWPSGFLQEALDAEIQIADAQKARS